jgi:excisionase family DNA binding protein
MPSHDGHIEEGDDMDSTDKALLDKVAASEYLSISVRTLDRLMAAGEVKAVKIGARVLFHHTTLDKFAAKGTSTGYKGE